MCCRFITIYPSICKIIIFLIKLLVLLKKLYADPNMCKSGIMSTLKFLINLGNIYLIKNYQALVKVYCNIVSPFF